MRALGVAKLLGSRNCTERILSPGSKLATSRHLHAQTEPNPLQKKALDHIANLKKM
jgi:hypothetical protein